MNKDSLQTISTFLVTLALLAFAFVLVQEALNLALITEKLSPETVVAGVMALANAIVIAAVARWLQQGAQHTAEKQAEKIQEAVESVKGNGNSAH